MADEKQKQIAPEAADASAEAPAGGRRKLLLFGGAAVLAATLVGGGLLLVLRARPSADASPVPDAEQQAEHDGGHGKVDGVDLAEELEIAAPSANVASSSEAKEGHGEGHGEGAAASGPVQVGKIYKLEPFVVNIADNDRDRYLKLKADLELSEDAVSAELEQRLSQVRDLVISLLGAKSFEDIRTIEGKNFLREEMLTRINAVLVTGQAKRIYFTEFVVQ